MRCEQALLGSGTNTGNGESSASPLITNTAYGNLSDVSADAHSADMPADESADDNDPLAGPVRAGDLLWTPSPERVGRANITAFIAWLKQTRGLDFAGYPELWQWSVTDLDAFWRAVWDYNDIIAQTPPTATLGRKDMPWRAVANGCCGVIARGRAGACGWC